MGRGSQARKRELGELEGIAQKCPLRGERPEHIHEEERRRSPSVTDAKERAVCESVFFEGLVSVGRVSGTGRPMTIACRVPAAGRLLAVAIRIEAVLLLLLLLRLPRHGRRPATTVATIKLGGRRNRRRRPRPRPNAAVGREQ